MFCSRKANKKINKPHEKVLRIIYQDGISNFEEWLEKDNSFSIHYLCQRKYTWTSKLIVISVWWKSHKCPPLEVIKSQDVHAFFIINSIFHLSLRLVREDVNSRLKVAKEEASQPKLLRRLLKKLWLFATQNIVPCRHVMLFQCLQDIYKMLQRPLDVLQMLKQCLLSTG